MSQQNGQSATEADEAPEPETVLVTMVFDAAAGKADALVGVLSKYVVLTRQTDGCRNVDLCLSVTTDDRFVIVQKWEHDLARSAHFDSDLMVEMAQSCTALLAGPPAIDLLEGLSAHDLA